MKIEVSANELRRVMKLLGAVIERRHPVPILSAVLLEAAPGKMSLTATDLDIQLRIEIEAETQSSGQIILLHRTLLGITEAADGPVTIEVEGNGGEVAMSSRGVTARVRTLFPPDEWPEMKFTSEEPSTAAWEMSQKDADRLFRLARHCISKEETRYYLNGVFLTTKPDAGTLRSVATDGRRMAVVDTGVGADDECRGIVPVKCVATILNLLDRNANEPARFELWADGAPRIRFSMEGVDMVAKMIDGTFPDYQRVVPTDADGISISLDRAGLRRMSRAARMLEPYSGGAVKFDPEAETMGLEGAGGDSVAMPAQITVKEGVTPAPVGFNLAYLLAQAEATPTFRLTQKTSGDPAMVHGEDPDAFFVIMPMRV